METTPLLPRPARRPFLSRLRNCFYFKRKDVSPRYIILGELPADDFPKNTIRNQKYNVITFLPFVLFQQFRYFLNFYFLIMALSQFIPSIRIGYLYTYWGPLCFVLTVTLFREAVDDIRRYRRDKEVNTQQYERVALNKDTECCSLNYETQRVPASAIRVGDIVILQKGQRVPADMILLRTNEIIGTVFLRTDQLDGETDWKLRIPVSSTQKLEADSQLLNIRATIFVEKPQQDIHSFVGTWTRLDEEEIDSLDIENTLWSGCVVASGQATGLVIYTGSETRSVMNNEMPRSKMGQLDLQVNDLTKVLFGAVMFLSFLMIVLKSFSGPWYRFMFRFVLLFSYIIPISLRVNLDMGKAFYSWAIQRDKKIEGTVMRSTTIPEELGRIKYLLADKTGTLTKNEMVFQRLHLEKISFDQTSFHEVETLLTQCITKQSASTPAASPTEELLEEPYPLRIWETVLALALCHNVTPVYQTSPGVENDNMSAMGSDMVESVVSEGCGGSVPQQQLCDYQASSPDEVALVKWTDMMGVSLYHRDLHSISLKVRATNDYRHYNILQIFPFTSETKMMGVIVEDLETKEIVYYVKGADVALAPLLGHPQWLKRDSSHLASEGLRTLGVAKSLLTRAEYMQFENDYKEARLSVANRGERTTAAMSKLQSCLTLLAVTGVEDRLADNVSYTLQLVRGAGIKVWMLTGDKLETALCIANSLHLNGAVGTWEMAGECRSRHDLHNQLQLISQTSSTSGLIIGGDTLEMCVGEYPEETMNALERCACVVVARCSPTQKSGVAKLLRSRGQSVCAVGDGGNDVAMIQQANIGVGIEGAEGRAASLAGDVSVRQFSALARLLLVHGRRAYMRSAALSLFIVHRGLIISTMQAVFSCVFYFSSVSLYPGFLMVGYGTLFTLLPVFSLVLDRDIPSTKALSHPGLYKQLSKGCALSYKTFWIWTAISIYQGGVIMFGALVMFEDELIHIVAISYSALILTELIMVALTIDTWHRLMIVAEVISFIMYIITLCWFNEYFDADFIKKWDFIWKVIVITAVSCLPLYVVKFTHKIIVSKQMLVEPIA